MKTLLTSILLFLFCIGYAQTEKEETKQLLTNGKYRQWKVIGTESHLGTKSCDNGDIFYTFNNDKVVIQQCVYMSWMREELSFSGEKEGEKVNIHG